MLNGYEWKQLDCVLKSHILEATFSKYLSATDPQYLCIHSICA